MTTRATVAILRSEAAGLSRSWLVRFWLGLAVLLAFFAVINASNDHSVARVIEAWLGVYTVPSAICFGILGTGCLGSDLDVAADSVLSRAVTRLDFVAGKVGSRMVAAVIGDLAVSLPTMFLIEKFGTKGVDAYQIVIVAVASAVLLLFLVALGSALGAVLRNAVVAVAALMVIFAFQSVMFDFLGLDYLSPTALLRDVQDWLHGNASAWEQARFFIAFTTAAVAMTGAAVLVFEQRDL